MEGPLCAGFSFFVMSSAVTPQEQPGLSSFAPVINMCARPNYSLELLPLHVTILMTF